MDGKASAINNVNTPLRLGIIGCGAISAKHLEAITANAGRIELVGAVDIDAGRAEGFASRYSDETGNPAPQVYAESEAMISECNPDVSIVALPSAYHFSHAQSCLRSGHLVVEKPIALSSREAHGIAETARELGRKVAVGYVLRFQPHVRALLSALHHGRFGRIYSAYTNILWNRNDKYYTAAPWRGTWEVDGGTLMNQCTHAIDLLQAVLGGVPRRVYGVLRRFSKPIEAEDFGTAIVEFDNGAVGTINGTVNAFPENYEESLGVFGEHGTVVLGGKSLERVLAWRFADAAEHGDTEQAVTSGQFSFPGAGASTGHSALLADLIEAIDYDREPVVNAEEACTSVDIILGIQKSMKEQRPVDLPVDFATKEMKGIFGREE